ncbi:hypothetical protein WwAna1177 [Wolbachia endosymbiont of Drosophila ananassae]|nr:hypothetical protein WwAna1177 [Wolbachia endosymbiont of Drosophila ananassae]
MHISPLYTNIYMLRRGKAFFCLTPLYICSTYVATILINVAGRWHIGRGFDCVCKSVPLSNLLGPCFAYSGCPRVFTVSLKSAGAKYVVNVLAVPSGKQ